MKFLNQIILAQHLSCICCDLPRADNGSYSSIWFDTNIMNMR